MAPNWPAWLRRWHYVCLRIHHRPWSSSQHRELLWIDLDIVVGLRMEQKIDWTKTHGATVRPERICVRDLTSCSAQTKALPVFSHGSSGSVPAASWVKQQTKITADCLICCLFSIDKRCQNSKRAGMGHSASSHNRVICTVVGILFNSDTGLFWLCICLVVFSLCQLLRQEFSV